VKEKKFKSVNIWQSYKQERDCLVHFLRLLALCWPSAQSTGVCCRQANQQQAVRVLSCIVSSECEHQSRPHFWAKRLMLVTYRYVTIGNCVLKTAEWLNGLGNCTDVFYVFNVFFSKSKKHDFLRFLELLRTFLEHWYTLRTYRLATFLLTSCYCSGTIRYDIYCALKNWLSASLV